MGKTIAITQPTYLPWLGYFDLVARADVFVFLDSVQFEKQSWQSRNRIRTPKGDVQWLSVPIRKQSLSTVIKDIEIAPNPPGWRGKQMKTIAANLQKAPSFADAEMALGPALGEDHAYLAELNMAFIKQVAGELGARTQFVRASKLPCTGGRDQLLLNICNHFEADRYYSNAGSSIYLEESRSNFESQGVELVFQNWLHPTYEQHGIGFVSHLSIIDTIAAVGWGGVREFLKLV